MKDYKKRIFVIIYSAVFLSFFLLSCASKKQSPPSPDYENVKQNADQSFESLKKEENIQR